MTVKKALEQLRYEIEEEGHCSFIEDEMYVAFECMEKQIPKNPIKKNPLVYQKDKDGQEHYAYDNHCPLCDKKLKFSEHHCPCGQAIDWSNSQEENNLVKCIDCKYLELELPYGVCSKAYKGMVSPDDSCGRGKKNSQ